MYMGKSRKRIVGPGPGDLEPYVRMQRWYLCQKMAQLIFYTRATNEQIEKHYTKVVEQFNKETE